MNQEPSQEFLKREFMHSLSDTLALLGADEDLVEKIQSIKEKPFTSKIIEELKSFNYDQLVKVKTRLGLCHTYTVRRDNLED
jgi:hypothetical protein